MSCVFVFFGRRLLRGPFWWPHKAMDPVCLSVCLVSVLRFQFTRNGTVFKLQIW